MRRVRRPPDDFGRGRLGNRTAAFTEPRSTHPTEGISRHSLARFNIALAPIYNHLSIDRVYTTLLYGNGARQTVINRKSVRVTLRSLYQEKTA